LGNADDQDSGDPFSLDEEEQDITTFGRRSNAINVNQNPDEHHSFSVSRGLTSLFSSGPAHSNNSHDDFDTSLDESSSSGSGSDIEADNQPLEARRSLERRPLDVDDDEEMGEMVAPTEESGNSSDEEILSPTEREQVGRGGFGISGSADADADEQNSEFAGQDDQDDDDDGDQLVEIAMPSSSKRRSRG
jgi:hypothetical protein